ncbi:MAG: 23S rRNA (adenine(2503)-C(2))-methyltransferase RlmN [Oscillospiraceae bacterium]|nr:23S rRNA (adenine(2503)-C(2))-methyltransferase RlmN [Oscillospiraceae bacterium]
METEKLDILSLSLDEIIMELDSMGEKKFRAEQIFNWLHVKKVTEFSEMSNISLELRTKLSEKFYIKRLNIVKRLESCVDNTIKYLYELDDGNHIETVLMDYKHGNSICISTQVGCKMGCNFCASTIAGFRRNLTPSEMLMQIYMAEKDSGRHADSLVLMGIGEPLDNYNNVVRFLELLSAPKGRNMSLRHVSLSTCGIVPKINELAKLKTGLTLSVSLHSADNERRSEIMPVNKSWDIEELIGACKSYIRDTGRRISFEYAVISGVNDSPRDAEALAGLLRGMNCHINLIPVNKIKERSYSADRSAVEQFSKRLERLGMNVTVRRTLGADINAACGQLRREYEI